MILVLGKAGSHKMWNLGYRGAKLSGWFDVSPKISAGDLMPEGACCHDEAANHQLPLAAQIVSSEKCFMLMQNLKQIPCCTNSGILNVMSTQDAYSLNGVYHPHWLVQWCNCSRMHIPVYSLCLLGYFKSHSFSVYKQWLDFFCRHLVCLKSMKFPWTMTPHIKVIRRQKTELRTRVFWVW